MKQDTTTALELEPREHYQDFLQTGPCERDGWVPGLMIDLDVYQSTQTVQMRVCRASRYEDDTRNLRLLSRSEDVELAAATPELINRAVGVARQLLREHNPEAARWFENRLSEMSESPSDAHGETPPVPLMRGTAE
jgi:hypothetical protein